MNNPIINAGNLPDSKKYQDRQGLINNPGPHIGIVKYNADPTRSGKLWVYIPKLGNSNEEDSSSWVAVTYASPFFGKTQGKVSSLNEHIQSELHNGTAQEENSFQSYGMWMVPPDVGVRVLCIFIDGEIDKGFWIACINDSYDSHMIPAIGAGKYTWAPGKLKTHAELQNYIDMPGGLPEQLPLTEAFLKDQLENPDSVTEKRGMVYKKNLTEITRYPHVFQSMRLGMQGLSHDSIRGTTTSSSHRESPSQVFGISTPGRLWMNRDGGGVSGDDLLKNFRIGGHQFVMDDGKYEDGNDQMIKIRTAKGNTILLDDTNEQIYIVNARGTAWIELSPSGKIDIFSDSDFSVRSKGSLNFHAEKEINMHCRGKFQLKSEASINIESSCNLTAKAKGSCKIFSRNEMEVGSLAGLSLYGAAALNIKTNGVLAVKGSMVFINSAPPGKVVTEPTDIPEQTHPKTQQVKKGWWPQGTFKSIASRAPDHEPWPNHEKPKP
jgi:hypothetical protein